MGLVPLVLVLSAASAHATWNFLAKRSGGGVTFVWLYAIAGLTLYAPAALIQVTLRWQRFSWAGLGFMAGSGILHAGYFTALQRGYAEGDLSLVYPLARGTGPLLSVIAALVILRERASPPGLLGAALIIAAVLSLVRGAREEGAALAITFGILTGAFTAAYTIWDAHAVTALHQPAIVYYWGAEATQVVVLTPLIWRQRAKLRGVWNAQHRLVLGVGALSPAAYILVLVALTLAPVIFVAPAREVSIVFGVLLGANVLGEGQAVQRMLAATAILVGIVLLAVA
ncbi:MAG: hypothetical protein JO168_10030 [Solirubrobacterales bacterium]|nr:hypothetical protein [Solirubrobacterales bacterium]MBV9715928.1 hypothetical protein [Solirubrobacterales bacterium]